MFGSNKVRHEKYIKQTWVASVTAGEWIAGGIVGGALIGGIGANKAAGQQAGAANHATDTQLQMFDKTQQNLSPYMDAGTGALTQLTQGIQPGGSLMPQSYTPYTMDMYKNSPEYQLTQNNQADAITGAENRASLGGGANSNNMKSLMNWTQGNSVGGYQSGLNDYMQQFLTGNQARAQQFNTLDTVSGSGQNAAAGLGALSANVGQNVGNNIIGAGNANAAGTVGVSNALTSGIGQGYNAWIQQQYLNGSGGNGMDPAMLAANGINPSTGNIANTGGAMP